MVGTLTIVFRNISRRKLRTLLTIIGIALGIGLMFSLLSLTATGVQRSYEVVRRLTEADIVVYNSSRGFTGIWSRAGFQREPTPMVGMAVGGLLDESVYKSVSSVPGVRTASPVLMSRASVSSATVNLYGVDPSTYKSVASIEIVDGVSISGLGVYEAIVGKSLAEDLNISVGNYIDIGIANTTTQLRVVGIFQSTDRFREYAIYIPIDVAQNITNNIGKMSQILIKCEDASQVSTIAQYIQTMYPEVTVFTPTAMLQNVSSALNTITYFFTSVGLVAVTAGLFGIMNTMMMAVAERTREIGILKSVGAGSLYILELILLESMFIGLIGGASGIILGVILSYAVAPMLMQTGASRALGISSRNPGPPTGSVGFTPSITPANIAISLALGTLVGIVAGLYPAYRASRMRPVEALRYV